jgi:hypothetical protein
VSAAPVERAYLAFPRLQRYSSSSGNAFAKSGSPEADCCTLRGRCVCEVTAAAPELGEVAALDLFLVKVSLLVLELV